MEAQVDEYSPIYNLLKANPRGMSVTDIAQATGTNRNTVSRYLEIMLISGQVEMKTYGKAKVFFLSQRVPISTMLNFSSDLVIVLDREFRVVQVNDAACSFAGASREEILAKDVGRSPLAALDHPLIRMKITEAMEGREVVEELRFLRNEGERIFRIKVIPTVFNDGSPGVTVILEDITDHKRSEEALRESELLYRSLVENINDVIWNVNEHGVFSYVSPKSREVLGYAPEEMVGRTPCDFMTPAEAERVRNHAPFRIAPHEAYSLFEYTMLHKDGHAITLETSGTPMFDVIGDFVGYREICRDITDRKRATKRLEQWKSFLNSVVNNIPDMVVVQEMQNSTFVFFNRAAEEFLGFTGDEMWGRRASDLFPQEIAGLFEDERLTLFRAVEVAVRDNNGNVRILAVKKIPLHNAKGDLRYMLGIAKDVTDRKTAEARIVAERDRAQSYLDAAGVIIAVITPDGSIDLINRMGCRLLGRDECDVTGKDWFIEFVPERLRERLRSNFNRLMAGEIEPPAFEKSPVLARDGTERTILWHNALLRDASGKVIAMVSSGEEVA